jgi:glyoxylase-like metal-dependent hydrolase (beta-lactamase superfamily II)
MVDVVVITHGHGDHVGGLIDKKSGAPCFPNAEVVLSDIELELWTSPDAASHLPEWAKKGLQNQQTTFAALKDRLRTIKPGADVVPGVNAQFTPGHTQGHLSLLVTSGSEHLFITGDAIAGIFIPMEHPDWHIIWDHDQELGVKTRRRLLDQLATERSLVTGFHFPFPGLGHIVRSGDAYHWVPADWIWTM